jgi:hypothetical protein
LPLSERETEKIERDWEKWAEEAEEEFRNRKLNIQLKSVNLGQT